MREIKENCYKGTRILLGNEKRNLINLYTRFLLNRGFEEISIPIIQFQETFKNKVGEENNNLMFNFTDRGNREICLAPEYTAVVQQLSSTTFKYQKDVKLFYVQQCFRGESPQAGRYREFTQFGVEIVNPSIDYTDYLIDILLEILPKESVLVRGVKRGLDYYNESSGFEFLHGRLGSSKQIVGGGSYEGGIGFAIGIDRVMMVIDQLNNN